MHVIKPIVDASQLINHDMLFPPYMMLHQLLLSPYIGIDIGDSGPYITWC